MQAAMVLQLNHQRARRALEQHGGATFAERRRQADAMWTHPSPFHVAIKRMATGRAMRRFDERKLARTDLAQVEEPALVTDQPAAMHTDWGKDGAPKPVRELDQSAHGIAGRDVPCGRPPLGFV